VACEEMRAGESAGSPGVLWAPGVGSNGGTRRGHAKPSMRRREIGGRERDECAPGSRLAYHVGAKQPS
jgi:hypothetical protein